VDTDVDQPVWEEATARRIAWLNQLDPSLVRVPDRPWCRVADTALYLESLRRDAGHGPHGPRAEAFERELAWLHETVAVPTRVREIAAATTVAALDRLGARIRAAVDAGDIGPGELGNLRQAWVDRRLAIDHDGAVVPGPGS